MARAQHDGPFRVDLDERPLVRILTPTVSSYEHVSVSSYFACVDDALALGTPFVILHDARDMPHVDDARRLEFMAMLEPRRPAIERRLAGYAAIVGSPVERALVTAFMWFAKLPSPVRPFASEAEARKWCLSRVQKPLPVRARSLPVQGGA